MTKPAATVDAVDFVYAVRYHSHLGFGDFYVLVSTESAARRKVKYHRGMSTATVMRAPLGEWEEVPDA